MNIYQKFVYLKAAQVVTGARLIVLLMIFSVIVFFCIRTYINPTTLCLPSELMRSNGTVDLLNVYILNGYILNVYKSQGLSIAFH